MKKNTLFLLFVLLVQNSFTQDLLLTTLKSEVDRSFSVLKEQPVPAYYISYRVYDTENYKIQVSFGNLLYSAPEKSRSFHTIVRVGSPELDNTHDLNLRGGNYYTFPERSLALEDDPFAWQTALWNQTDKYYKEAVSKYEKAKTNIAVNVGAEDKSNDFSVEKPEKYYEKPLNTKTIFPDPKQWENKLKKYSALFVENKDIVDAKAIFIVELIRKYFVDSDGAEIAENTYQYRLSIDIQTVADDGMELPLYKSYFAYDLKELPTDEQVITDVKKMSGLLSELRKAPVAESYSGPALMTAQTSGVFFHEIFGHRIEGARLKQESNAQTFKKMIGEMVLPEDFSIRFDPQIKTYKGIPLNGSYVFDDEGVRGQKVTIVENGVLKSFLMSRNPIEGFPNSNGHGRGLIGYNPVTRQSNLIVESNNEKTAEELKRMLIEETKKQHKPYAYLFDEVSGGFTSINRNSPNAFNVKPLLVYRIYVDGRPDELVRGVNLLGTPLSMFSQIAACGKDYAVFNGSCGAESGWLPVSAVSPTLFVKIIETQKQSKSQSKPPILARPANSISTPNPILLDAMQEECNRNLSELKMDNLQTPFFISSTIADSKELNITAAFGSLTRSSENANRSGDSRLLVGNYGRNNNSTNQEMMFGNRASYCLDNDAGGIKTTIWSDLDKKYKNAVGAYESKLLNIRQKQLKEEDLNLPDFEKTEPVNLASTPKKINQDKVYWENYAKKASEIVKKYPEILYSEVKIFVRDRNIYYYNTEGSRYVLPDPYYQIKMDLSALTDDGQELSDEMYIEHSFSEQLPDLQTYIKQCEEFISLFLELRKAPIIDETYNGPVLIEKMALAETFQNQIVRPSLIAKRQAISGYRGNNVENMMDKKIISRSLSIKSLSGTETYKGIHLDGYYPVDAEGVIPDKELVLVENGVLKNLLNGRTPTKKIRHSNGHSRFNTYSLQPDVMPGNLQLTSNNTYTNEELKQKLIDAAKEEDLEYTYIVRRLRVPNITTIYKVDVKSGNETLVRGASISDLNIKAFKRVSGASNQDFVYNTTAFGPLTSYIIPDAMLFEELEVTYNNINHRLPYLISRPEAKK